MTAQGWLQIAIYVAVLTALVPVLGAYMARVYQGERVLLSGVLGPIERLTYRALRTDPDREQDWKAYAKTTVVFSALFWLALYVILRGQGIHIFNPNEFGAAPWDVTFNTTSSFITNTNWQYYSGETTMTYLAQMAGLAVQNFVSAGVGMAVLAAVIRGFARRNASTLGNFWVDLTRTLLYILVPLAFIGALILVSQGVVQTLSGPVSFTTALGADQTIALGPAASQIAIKQLGTNGGGFFNVNSSFPFENATAFSNFVEVIFILLIPAALTATYGRMVGRRRQGWALYAAMLVMFVVGIATAYPAEQHSSPVLREAGITASAKTGTTGGNLQDKEQRFGIANSALWATATTDASNGSVNSAHESFTGIGGMVPIVNMATGEVIFGGVGSGLYGMLLFVLLTVFIAGLMVGRTPEYLGKKIEAREMKLVVIGTIFVPMMVLIATGLAISWKYGGPSIFNSGPHGFSETLYAYTSQSNNNGSAFAGYTGFVQPNAPGNAGAFGITFADLLGGLCMLFGRFVPLLAALAVAGSLAGKRVSPRRSRNLPDRLADLRGAARRRRDPRRRAHLPSGPCPRPAGRGPYHPALLMKRDLTASVVAVVICTLALGLAYPLLTTGVAQVLFPNKADGSQVERGGKVVGSKLIGQDFSKPVLGADGKPKEDADGNPVLAPDPAYFQARPSQTGYAGNASGFLNQGPNQQELADLTKERIAAYLKLERPFTSGLTVGQIPVDAVTNSASGVDPHISEANARIQANRVARVRNAPLARIRALIDDNTDGRFLGLLGEPGVNVLKLNLALDKEFPRT